MALGDTVVLGTGRDAVRLEVVGIADDVVGGSQVYVRDGDARIVEGLWVDVVLYDGDPAALPDWAQESTVTVQQHVAAGRRH